MLRQAAVMAGALLTAGCSVVGVSAGTPQPPYDVLGRIDPGVELRRYAQRIAAEVTVARPARVDAEGRAFSRLASYIFGDNRSRDSIDMTSPVEVAGRPRQIAMTAPVESVTMDDVYRMRFFLPAGYTIANAPIPNDTAVSVVELETETMAVMRFSGSRGDAAVAQHTRELLDALRNSGWRAVSDPVAFFYDPPWTLPSLRRNEVAVAVSRE